MSERSSAGGPPARPSAAPHGGGGEQWVKLAGSAGDDAGVLDALAAGREVLDEVSVVAGIARLRSALHGRQLAVIAGYVARRRAEITEDIARDARELAEANPGRRVRPPFEDPAEAAFREVATELALALGEHPTTARALVGDALQLEDLPATTTALAEGAITRRHLGDILGGASTLTDKPGNGPVFDRRIADYARAHAPGPTGREAGRLVLELEPEAGAEREQAAVERRDVVVRPGEDGLDRLVADLPVADMAAVREVFDRAVTAALSRGGEERTVGQLRADLLVDWAYSALAADHALPGHCPGCTCDPAGPGTRPAEPTAGTAFGRLAAPRDRSLPFFRVTLAASTLAGLDDLPVDVAGRGPASADWLRRLVTALRARGEPLRAELVITDDEGHPVTRAQGRDGSYRPRAATDRAVRDRDGTCRAGDCRIPARHCDLDHSEPWDGDPDGAGPTHPGNLAALCRGHHQEKTAGQWALAHTTTPRPDLDGTGFEATGELTITTRSGRRYTLRPDRLPHGAIPGDAEPAEPAAPTEPPGDDPPPF